MKNNLVDELRWRGLLQDMMPGTEELLSKETVTAYIGFDPTADSLHIGHLIQVMLLVHIQACGHKPIALVGGATGMIGDPSGRSSERNLLNAAVLNHNVSRIKQQLSRFLAFEGVDNPALIVNNYDWIGQFTLIDFLRDVGKHLTVNYMMAKDSVKKRLETGLSFTEFSYQLLQGYDFFHLHTQFGAKLQMGGSDQWGNITSGTELIRRIAGTEAFGLVSPLLTRADGSKFGKSEGQNVWIDAARTSPYKFYQFWLNVSDEEALKYCKIFTLKSQSAIEQLATSHAEAPHQRLLQKALAEDITLRVHGQEGLTAAQTATDLLFGKGTTEQLTQMSEHDLLAVFDGVPQFVVIDAAPTADLGELLVTHAAVFPSKSELRKLIQGGGLSINKVKVQDVQQKRADFDLLQNKFWLIQKGKKNYILVIFNP